MTRLPETKCPFYQRERTLSITCEGLIDKTMMQIKFPDADMRLQHQRCYCRSIERWHLCLYARILELKYEAHERRLQKGAPNECSFCHIKNNS